MKCAEKLVIIMRLEYLMLIIIHGSSDPLILKVGQLETVLEIE